MNEKQENVEQKNMNDTPGSITASQKGYLEGLLRKTNSHFDGDFELLSKQAASEEIDRLEQLKALQEKSKQNKGSSTAQPTSQVNVADSDATNGILIGMAMKIVAYKKGVKDVLANSLEYEDEVVALHQILVKARQKCLASSF